MKYFKVLLIFLLFLGAVIINAKPYPNDKQVMKDIMKQKADWPWDIGYTVKQREWRTTYSRIKGLDKLTNPPDGAWRYVSIKFNPDKDGAILDCLVIVNYWKKDIFKGLYIYAGISASQNFVGGKGLPTENECILMSIDYIDADPGSWFKKPMDQVAVINILDIKFKDKSMKQPRKNEIRFSIQMEVEYAKRNVSRGTTRYIDIKKGYYNVKAKKHGEDWKISQVNGNISGRVERLEKNPKQEYYSIAEVKFKEIFKKRKAYEGKSPKNRFKKLLRGSKGKKGRRGK